MALKAKGKKIGRNKASCEQYRREERREKSKARRLVKHMRHRDQQNDECAKAAYVRLPEHIKKKAEKQANQIAAE